MGSVRIIAGKWRSRKIAVADVAGLRPTPNVVRETLFNWLASVIHGAQCLDLFAGSGALSFEALSRGAQHVVATDSSGKALKELQENARVLGAENITILHAKIPQQLVTVPTVAKFDIVFLDPPFNCNLVFPTIQQLEQLEMLAPHALVYVEMEKSLEVEKILPSSWKVLRHKTVGMVSYCLVRFIPLA